MRLRRPPSSSRVSSRRGSLWQVLVVGHALFVGFVFLRWPQPPEHVHRDREEFAVLDFSHAHAPLDEHPRTAWELLHHALGDAAAGAAAKPGRDLLLVSL